MKPASAACASPRELALLVLLVPLLALRQSPLEPLVREPLLPGPKSELQLAEQWGWSS